MKNKILNLRILLLPLFSLSITIHLQSQQLLPAIENDASLNNYVPFVQGSYSAASTLSDCNRQEIIDDYNVNYLGSAFTASELAWDGNTASCDPGSFSSTVHNKILQRINYFRRLAKVSDAIIFDSVKDEKCLEAALMQKANGGLSHCTGFNNAPCDTWSCNTSDAIEASQKSNLAINSWGFANPIDMYMEDFGASNINVGHRRWILFSRGNEMGNGMTNNTHALWVIGDYAATPTYEDFIAYPASGFFPRSLIYNRWSFGIPGANFSNAAVSMKKNGESIPVDIISSTAFIADPTLVWSVSSTYLNFDNSQDTEYEITVSGITGAVQSAYTYTVIAIKEESPNISFTTQHPYCENNGSATASLSAGANGFNWNTENDTTESITDLYADTYFVTVTDHYECEFTDSVILVTDNSLTPQPGDGTPQAIQFLSGNDTLLVYTEGTVLKTDEATGWWITKTQSASETISNQTELDTALYYANISPTNDGSAINTNPSLLFLQDNIEGKLVYDCANMDPAATYFATPFVAGYRETIPDTSCVVSNGVVGNIQFSGKPAKYTSVSPESVDCRPDTVLNQPVYILSITVSDYTGPAGQLSIIISDDGLSGNTLFYNPFFSGNGTYEFIPSDFQNYIPNDPGDPDWITGLTAIAFEFQGNGMQNGNIELSLDITYPGDPGIAFPTMDYSSCIFGTPVPFSCGECTAPQNIPSSTGIYYATDECTDANGWTHYWDNVDGISGNANDLLLLSIEKGVNDIGNIGDGTFEVFIEIGNDGAVIPISNTAPYVSNPNGWYVMDRYWSVTPTSPPGSPTSVRFYYSNDDFTNINDAPDVGPILHEELVFYKTKENTNPDPATGHTTITSEQIQLFNTEGSDWQYTGDGQNNYHTAELFSLTDYSGGGGGSSDCPGCGPLPVELISFSGRPENKSVRLFWETASEVNNDYFTLERSSDGVSFEWLSEIKGSGNSPQIQQYTYVDLNPNTGTNYYRLSQTDFDGTKHFAATVIAIEIEAERTLTLFPNPAKGQLFVKQKGSEWKDVSYQIFDVAGRLVEVGKLVSKNNKSTQAMDIDKLPRGLYLIQFIDAVSLEFLSFIKE